MAEVEDQDRISRIDPLHYADASAREKLVEHVFLGDLLRALWLRKIADVSVLAPRSTAEATISRSNIGASFATSSSSPATGMPSARR